MRVWEVLDGPEHLAWTHMRWLGVSASVGAGPYLRRHELKPLAREANLGWVPCEAAQVRVPAWAGDPSGVRRFRAHNNRW